MINIINNNKINITVPSWWWKYCPSESCFTTVVGGTALWNPEIMVLLLWNTCLLCIARSQSMHIYWWGKQSLHLTTATFALHSEHCCTLLCSVISLLVIKEGLASLHLSDEAAVLVPQCSDAKCGVLSEWMLELAADRRSCSSFRRESVTTRRKEKVQGKSQNYAK